MHQLPVSCTALPILLGAIVVVEREFDIAEEAQLLVGEQLYAVAIGGHGHAQRLILEPADDVVEVRVHPVLTSA